MSTHYGRMDVGGARCATVTMRADDETREPEEAPPAGTTLSPDVENGKRNLDEQEFQQVYEDHCSLIYRYVVGHVGNREEAEDLTAQIFLKAVRGIDTGRDALSRQKWLFRVARTTLADYWRTHYRIPVQSLDALLETGWEGPAEEDAALASNEPEARVHRLLQALPERDREVLTCRFLLALSVKDTAVRMGLTEANVKVLQYRALKRAAELDTRVAPPNH